MLIPDHETNVDLLNYEAIARTTVRLLETSKAYPITIGIHGQWGAGKSSVLKMVENAIADKNDIAFLQFNGWAFEGFDDSKTVLIESIVQELIRQRSTLSKVKDIGKNILKRINWIKAAKYGTMAGVSIATGVPSPTIITDVSDLITRTSEKVLDLKAEDIQDTLKSAQELLSNPNLAQVSEEIHYIREEFKQLLEEAKIDQLIVLIDDLDRCLPETAIHTLEAIKLFLFVPKTAFIIAADDVMIEYAVKQHFPDLPLSSGPTTYARNYLEKLIQVPFRIPELGSEEAKAYITLLLVQNIVGEKNLKFKELLSNVREKLKRPWLSIDIEQASVEAIDPSKKKALNSAYLLSLQIAPILAKGTKGNPRQIKRFLNTLLLRQEIAKERGFGDDIKISVLAKLMLAENFKQTFYTDIVQLSMASKDGKVPALEVLEKKRPSTKKEPKNTKDAADEPNPWLDQPWLLEWGMLSPSILEEDLRPYIFVARDKRPIIEGEIMASGLNAMLEKLKGSALVISGIEADIKTLPESSVREIFGKLREAVLRDGFQTKPAGFDGLRMLAKHHKFIQPDLVTLVGSLDINELGMWIVSGWEPVLTDTLSIKAFDKILLDWSKQDTNKVLQTISQQAISRKK